MNLDTGTDYIIRASADDGHIRAFAAASRNTVETARQAHNTSPVVTAALGRLLTAGAMMGIMLKGSDIMTLQVKGDGPVKGLTVTADADGHVKGYAVVPQVILHAREDHKLDVAAAVGKGTFRVIKDLGLKEPYIGETEIVSGEIAEDLTYYFAQSEQVPSAVGLGVLLSAENTLEQAGGFIIQLMPDVSEESIVRLEENLKKISSVTQMMSEGKTPEDILGLLLDGLGLEILEKCDTSFRCDCSSEKIEKALISIGRQDLQDMIKDGKEIEMTCSFCGRRYKISVDELKKLYEEAK